MTAQIFSIVRSTLNKNAFTVPLSSCLSLLLNATREGSNEATLLVESYIQRHHQHSVYSEDIANEALHHYCQEFLSNEFVTDYLNKREHDLYGDLSDIRDRFYEIAHEKADYDERVIYYHQAAKLVSESDSDEVDDAFDSLTDTCSLEDIKGYSDLQCKLAYFIVLNELQQKLDVFFENLSELRDELEDIISELDNEEDED